MWYLYVSSQIGAICLDTLKDEWTQSLTLRSVLLSLKLLLANPEPNSPQDGVVAQDYLQDYASFEKISRSWTNTYANESSNKNKKKIIAKLVEMEFLKTKQVQH